MQDIDIMTNCWCGGILNARICGDKVEIFCESCDFYSWFGAECLEDKKLLDYLCLIRRAISEFEEKNPNHNYDFSSVKKTIDSYVAVINAYRQAISD
jgi:hypothetical protein